MLNLLRQIWDNLEFVSVAPHTPIFLCNSIVSAVAGAPDDNPRGSVLSQLFMCATSQLCLAGRPNLACTPPGLRSPPCSQKLLQGSTSTITHPTALRTRLDLL